MDTVATLSSEIREKFDNGNYPKSEKLKVSKLKADFQKVQTKQLENGLLQRDVVKNAGEEIQIVKIAQADHESSFNEQIDHNKARENGQRYRRNSSDDEDNSGHPAIELQQVNQQTLFYERMIQLKEKQLIEIKQKMEQALKVQTEVGKMVKDQGKKLDIIEDNVDSARSNVKQAGQLLEEGVEHHKSANRKKMCIIGIVFVLLLIIIIPILVKVLG